MYLCSLLQVKGVVEEIQNRAGEEINNIRPRTSNGKRGKKRGLTFLRDLNVWNEVLLTKTAPHVKEG